MPLDTFDLCFLLVRVFLVSWNTSCRVRERDCPFSFVLSSIDFLFIWPALPRWFIYKQKGKKKKVLGLTKRCRQIPFIKKKKSFNRVNWVINELKKQNTSPKRNYVKDLFSYIRLPHTVKRYKQKTSSLANLNSSWSVKYVTIEIVGRFLLIKINSNICDLRQ